MEIHFAQMQIATIISEYKSAVRWKTKKGLRCKEFIDLIHKLKMDKLIPMPTDDMKELADFYRELDIDKNNLLDFNEFVACMVLMLNCSFEEKLLQMLHFYDNKGRNYISDNKFGKFIQSFSKLCEVVGGEDAMFLRNLNDFQKSATESFQGKKLPLSQLAAELFKMPFVTKIQAKYKIRPSRKSI